MPIAVDLAIVLLVLLVLLAARGPAVLQRIPVPDPGVSGGPSPHLACRLQAVIRHGNSARGYAISVGELRPVLADALASRSAVAPGSCTTSS